MFINDKKFVDVLCKYGLTPTQYFFAYMIHKGQYEELFRYCQTVDLIELEDIQLLEEKGFIIDTNKFSEDLGRLTTYSKKYICTSSFLDLIMRETDDLFEELLDMYPVFINVEGSRYPARSTNAGEKGQYSTAELYKKYIKGDLELHKKVLDLVEWAKNNDQIGCGLAKFVAGKRWEELQELKSGNARRSNTFDL